MEITNMFFVLVIKQHQNTLKFVFSVQQGVWIPLQGTVQIRRAVTSARGRAELHGSDVPVIWVTGSDTACRTESVWTRVRTSTKSQAHAPTEVKMFIANSYLLCLSISRGVDILLVAKQEVIPRPHLPVTSQLGCSFWVPAIFDVFPLAMNNKNLNLSFMWAKNKDSPWFSVYLKHVQWFIVNRHRG